MIVFFIIWWTNGTYQEDLVKADFLVKFGKEKFIEKFGQAEFNKIHGR